MGYLASNLAREIARHTGWTDKIWARHYQAIIISDEEAAQTARLSYLLSHGCKEGLVEQVRDWPGVHCVHALLDGTPAQGTWFDRTKEYGARQRGEEISPRRFATTETVTLSLLPCWQHLARRSSNRRSAPWWRTSKRRRPSSDQKHKRPSSVPTRCGRRNTRAVQPVRRNPTLRCSMPFPAAFAASSTRPTTCSWPPSVTHRKSCDLETATPSFRRAAFHLAYPS
jgi:hypothetical protein